MPTRTFWPKYARLTPDPLFLDVERHIVHCAQHQRLAEEYAAELILDGQVFNRDDRALAHADASSAISIAKQEAACPSLTARRDGTAALH